MVLYHDLFMNSQSTEVCFILFDDFSCNLKCGFIFNFVIMT